jgi:hypothetical protein
LIHQGHGEGEADHERQQPEDCALQRGNIVSTATARAHAKPTPDLAGSQDDDEADQEDRQQLVIV